MFYFFSLLKSIGGKVVINCKSMWFMKMKSGKKYGWTSYENQVDRKKKQNYRINSWILKQKSMEKAFSNWLWCFRNLRFTNVSSLQYGDQQIIRHFNFFSIKNKINTIRIQMDQLVGDMYSGVFQRNQTHFAIISRHFLFISWY